MLLGGWGMALSFVYNSVSAGLRVGMPGSERLCWGELICQMAIRGIPTSSQSAYSFLPHILVKVLSSDRAPKKPKRPRKK